MDFIVKTFDQLTTHELHDILQLRCDVLVVERNCVFHELDGKDPKSLHVFSELDGELATYARILPPGLKYEQESAIGRVVVRKALRGQRLGEKLITASVEASKAKWPNVNIKLSAQAHLQHFYNLNGFQAISEEYLEENLPHIAMELEVK